MGIHQTQKMGILNKLSNEFHRQGFEVEVLPETVCVHRDRWDNYSRQFLKMASAAPVVSFRDKGFRIYLTEQYDSKMDLKKYTIQFNDDQGFGIKAYDLDIKRGPHTHEFVEGQKQNKHVPFSNKIQDVVVDMLRMAQK